MYTRTQIPQNPPRHSRYDTYSHDNKRLLSTSHPDGPQRPAKMWQSTKEKGRSTDAHLARPDKVAAEPALLLGVDNDSSSGSFLKVRILAPVWPSLGIRRRLSRIVFLSPSPCRSSFTFLSPASKDSPSPTGLAGVMVVAVVVVEFGPVLRACLACPSSGRGSDSVNHDLTETCNSRGIASIAQSDG